MSEATFSQKNIVSDIGGSALKTDPDAKNPWGIVAADDNKFWVNLTDSSLLKLYDNKGKILKSFPTPDEPTGLVETVKKIKGGPELILVTESGVIAAYVPSIFPNPIVTKFTNAGSIYKGVAILGNYLYVTNFNNLRIDVFDITNYQFTFVKSIVDSDLAAAGYGPFNVFVYDNILYISYALLDPVEKEDDVRGLGNGYINVYSPIKNLLKRIINREQLNSPWAMIRSDDKLYIGNFGDGVINIYDIFYSCECKCHKNTKAVYCNKLSNKCNTPIQIDGLWGLVQKDSGNLLFAAGSQNEEHGLIGELNQ
jgi:uncharacterized protein (TIGR03118 family)